MARARARARVPTRASASAARARILCARAQNMRLTGLQHNYAPAEPQGMHRLIGQVTVEAALVCGRPQKRKHRKVPANELGGGVHNQDEQPPGA